MTTANTGYNLGREMELTVLAKRRRDSGMPLLHGELIAPKYLPGRRKDEKLPDFALRAPSDIKQYLRDVITWTREYPALAPAGFREFAAHYPEAK